MVCPFPSLEGKRRGKVVVGPQRGPTFSSSGRNTRFPSYGGKVLSSGKGKGLGDCKYPTFPPYGNPVGVGTQRVHGKAREGAHL